jgi:hypothetical protein
MMTATPMSGHRLTVDCIRISKQGFNLAAGSGSRGPARGVHAPSGVATALDGRVASNCVPLHFKLHLHLHLHLHLRSRFARRVWQCALHLANAPLESGASEVSLEVIRAVCLAAEAAAQTRAALAA